LDGWVDVYTGCDDEMQKQLGGTSSCVNTLHTDTSEEAHEMRRLRMSVVALDGNSRLIDGVEKIAFLNLWSILNSVSFCFVILFSSLLPLFCHEIEC